MTAKNHSVNEILRQAKLYLKNKSIGTYSIDAEILLMKVLNCTRIQLLTDNRELNAEKVREYTGLLEKRAVFMPVQYITNRCEFMSLDFFVNESTLIPRPDTEILVETAIKFIQKNNYEHILEIGTGTGCIAVSLAHYCKKENIKVTAVDISGDALNVARENATRHNVSDCIRFIESNLFENINRGVKFDAVVSNPPYIETDFIETLDEQVRHFEPHTALDGGADGLGFYRKIACLAPEYLCERGMVFFETGYNQANAVNDILAKNDFISINKVKDLAGFDRVVYGELE